MIVQNVQRTWRSINSAFTRIHTPTSPQKVLEREEVFHHRDTRSRSMRIAIGSRVVDRRVGISCQLHLLQSTHIRDIDTHIG